MWVNSKTGEQGIARDWQHIGLEGLDWPEAVEHVTGTDRGLLALMEHGNRIVTTERAALEAPAAAVASAASAADDV